MTRSLPTVSGGSGPRFIRHIGEARSVLPPDPPGQGDEMVLWPGDGDGDASVLVTHGTVHASVPEHAADRLVGMGVKSVIATGFEEQLYAACVARGVLPAILTDAELEELSAWVASEPHAKVTIDLEKEVIERTDLDPISFGVDPRMRNKLLLGLTNLEEMMRQLDVALDFRSEDRRRRPWLYTGPDS